MVSWRRREWEKQAHSRDRNEAAVEASAGTRADRSADPFVCECGDGSCTAAISLTPAEYESVRAYATRFAIARNHENPESERVVAESERFAVIETVSRDARKLARQRDPRQPS